MWNAFQMSHQSNVAMNRQHLPVFVITHCACVIWYSSSVLPARVWSSRILNDCSPVETCSEFWSNSTTGQISICARKRVFARLSGHFVVSILVFLVLHMFVHLEKNITLLCLICRICSVTRSLESQLVSGTPHMHTVWLLLAWVAILQADVELAVQGKPLRGWSVHY